MKELTICTKVRLTFRSIPPPSLQSWTVVIIGPSGAGKTSFLSRITKNEFKYSTMFTTGVDFAIKTFHIDSKVIKGLFLFFLLFQFQN
jgi:GTPase SAR1 family protein